VRLVIELVAGGGALSRGRGLPDGAGAFEGNRDGDIGSRLQVSVQLAVNDAVAVARRGRHILSLQQLADLGYRFSAVYATDPRRPRLRILR
jgi:hypothetical protein